MKIAVTELDLVEEIYDELSEELSAADDLNERLLRAKVEAAAREVIHLRNYPETYTEYIIEEDLDKFHSIISRLALADYNQAGAEGETMHIENNTQRMWRERGKLLHGVTPIGRLV